MKKSERRRELVGVECSRARACGDDKGSRRRALILIGFRLLDREDG
jgi:hypothetical protein